MLQTGRKMIPNDFAAFILTHGRPDRVHTFESLRRAGYTGRIFIVIDDEDKTGQEYIDRFGAGNVLTFNKREVASQIDEGDNFDDRRAIIYARNACFALARSVGVSKFIQLDDDYKEWKFRLDSADEYKHRNFFEGLTADDVFNALLEFHATTPALTVCLSQGGDHIGGGWALNMNRLKRKAMNTFVLSTDRPFEFFGRINEDVNTYTTMGRSGGLFFTVMRIMITQLQTQSNAGGMTETYLDAGTYLKSFYSVMYCPSAVKIGTLTDYNGERQHTRIHHSINWDATVPKIISESYRKATP